MTQRCRTIKNVGVTRIKTEGVLLHTVDVILPASTAVTMKVFYRAVCV